MRVTKHVVSTMLQKCTGITSHHFTKAKSNPLQKLITTQFRAQTDWVSLGNRRIKPTPNLNATASGCDWSIRCKMSWFCFAFFIVQSYTNVTNPQPQQFLFYF